MSLSASREKPTSRGGRRVSDESGTSSSASRARVLADPWLAALLRPKLLSPRLFMGIMLPIAALGGQSSWAAFRLDTVHPVRRRLSGCETRLPLRVLTRRVR
jgi:hypothetical protein